MNVQHFPEPKQSGASRTQHLGLAYDIVMLGLIGLNVLGIGLDLFLMTHMASTVASQAGLSGELLHYRQHWHQPFRNMDEWFTAFLLGEIILRWLLAIVQRTYPRWFFFPFVHWYEVLGCIPALRALRLLRAVAIGYRLYRMGCPVMPAAWLRQLRVYYDIVLEEISDRIVINVLNGVEREIRQSQGSHDLIRQLIERHRDELQSATEQLLQINLATQLRVHQPAITAAIGEVTHRALQDVPELRRMLRLMPVVGGLLENQLQVIGQQIAESLSRELVGLMAAPAPEGEQANALIRVIAAEVSQAQLQTPATEYLLESLVYETLDMLRRQVAVQQWKQHFAEDGDADPARSA